MHPRRGIGRDGGIVVSAATEMRIGDVTTTDAGSDARRAGSRQDVPGAGASRVPFGPAVCPGGVRSVVRRSTGHRTGPRRREWLGQVDGRAVRVAAARAHGRLGAFRGPGAHRNAAQGTPKAPARVPDGVPGPLRVVGPAHDGRRRDRGAVADPQGAGRSRRSGRGVARPRRALARPRPAVPARILRRSAPTCRDRAGPRIRTRNCSCSTSRSRRST